MVKCSSVCLLLLFIVRNNALKIVRNAVTGDVIKDIQGQDQSTQFCGRPDLTTCGCNAGETLIQQLPNRCVTSVAECTMKVIDNENKLHDLYTAVSGNQADPYKVNVTTGTNDPVCLSSIQPVFIRQMLTEMEWTARWSTDILDKRLQAKVIDNKIEVTFSNFWTGLLVNVYVGCRQSCFTIKFQGEREYPLQDSDIADVLGPTLKPITTEAPPTTTKSSTTTTPVKNTTTTELITPQPTNSTTVVTKTTSTYTLVPNTPDGTTKGGNTGALEDDSNDDIYIIIGVILLFFLLILVILCILCYIGRRRRNVALVERQEAVDNEKPDHQHIRHLNSNEEGLTSSPSILNSRVDKTFYDDINTSTSPVVPSTRYQAPPTKTAYQNKGYEDAEKGESSYEIPKEKTNPIYEDPVDKNDDDFHFTPFYNNKYPEKTPEYAVIKKDESSENSVSML